jgi:hypothetical protein
MSTLPPLAASSLVPPARPALAWRLWLREPLLHFLVLGAVLFGLDHALVARTDDRHVIVMDGAVDAEARQLFKASRGRDPGAAELEALRKVWLDNEVLYREGMAMQMDKGDSAIRERVIFKALSVVDANVKLPPIDDQVLSAWFDAHRAKYDDPARFDFQEAALAGDATEATVREFVTRLEGGTSGDAGAGLRVFKGRPTGNLVDSYGADFAKALQAAPAGHWQALHAKDGWRAVRLDRYTPPTPADFRKLRAVVQQDWTDATLAEQRSAAVRTLAAKYDVRTAAAK